MFNFDSIRHMEYLVSKKKEMLESCQEEKIVLLGGSSVLYGFNTDKMQQRLGKPTINAGVNVGLGFRYLVDHIEPSLKPGDHVILPLEFGQYLNPSYYIFGFGIDTFVHRKYWANRKKYNKKVKLFLMSLRHAKSSSTPEKMARRKATILTHTGCLQGMDAQLRNPQALTPLSFPESFHETEAMSEIKAFMKRCRNNNIQVTLLPPVFYADNMPDYYLTELYEYFCITVSPNIFRLKASEVYDSVYHANLGGQTRVTNKLIALLGT
ncbi:hypothetical protein [Listeria rocourtiae]|uniref:hypothetical protein n=1 Tax=Listeria rocourtiae TaxID=647910 RepID=UPI003D2F7D64